MRANSCVIMLAALLVSVPVILCAQVNVCLDPGHGCSNPANPDSCKPGNLMYLPNFDEEDINLNVALALKDTLDQHGFRPA